jgi:hypothetical protein
MNSVRYLFIGDDSSNRAFICAGTLVGWLVGCAKQIAAAVDDQGIGIVIGRGEVVDQCGVAQEHAPLAGFEAAPGSGQLSAPATMICPHRRCRTFDLRFSHSLFFAGK